MLEVDRDGVFNYETANTDLQQYDNLFGEGIENKMKYFAGYDLYNTFTLQTNRVQIQMMAENKFEKSF